MTGLALHGTRCGAWAICLYSRLERIFVPNGTLCHHFAPPLSFQHLLETLCLARYRIANAKEDALGSIRDRVQLARSNVGKVALDDGANYLVSLTQFLAECSERGSKVDAELLAAAIRAGNLNVYIGGQASIINLGHGISFAADEVLDRFWTLMPEFAARLFCSEAVSNSRLSGSRFRFRGNIHPGCYPDLRRAADSRVPDEEVGDLVQLSVGALAVGGGAFSETQLMTDVFSAGLLEAYLDEPDFVGPGKRLNLQTLVEFDGSQKTRAAVEAGKLGLVLRIAGVPVPSVNWSRLKFGPQRAPVCDALIRYVTASLIREPASSVFDLQLCPEVAVELAYCPTERLRSASRLVKWVNPVSIDPYHLYVLEPGVAVFKAELFQCNFDSEESSPGKKGPKFSRFDEQRMGVLQSVVEMHPAQLDDALRVLRVGKAVSSVWGLAARKAILFRKHSQLKHTVLHEILRRFWRPTPRHYQAPCWSVYSRMVQEDAFSKTLTEAVLEKLRECELASSGKS